MPHEPWIYQPGYRTLQVRTLVGHGPDAMRAATDAVMEWSMHRAIPPRIDASAPRAAPGVDVTVYLGLICAPCRIVWAEQTERWAGWAYGTLLRHPECDEEAFVMHRDDEDEVWLTVTAFSRPAAWYTRAAGRWSRSFNAPTPAVAVGSCPACSDLTRQPEVADPAPRGGLQQVTGPD